MTARGSSPEETHAGAETPSGDGVAQPCCVCGRRRPDAQIVRLRGLRRALASHLERTRGTELAPDARVCIDCRNQARLALLIEQLEAERGELSQVEAEVARKAAAHLAIAEHLDEEFVRTTTRGQRFADRVAAIGGSWPFVLGFVGLLVVWCGWNTWLLRAQAFDPYPYILLNLILSCIAALQAPIIMMSQNRMAARDRMQADQDFRINLKAEIEIASLHDKLDHVLHGQWQHMVELQEMQIELLNEILESRGGEAR